MCERVEGDIVSFGKSIRERVEGENVARVCDTVVYAHADRLTRRRRTDAGGSAQKREPHTMRRGATTTTTTTTTTITTTTSTTTNDNDFRV